MINKKCMIIIFISSVSASFALNNSEINSISIKLDPDYVAPHNYSQFLQFTCIVETDHLALNETNLKLWFEFNNIKEYVPFQCPNENRCESQFGESFGGIRTRFSIPENQKYFSFGCVATIQGEPLLLSAFGNVELNEGSAYGKHCDLTHVCNQKANLTCNEKSKICKCKDFHVPIPLGSFDQNCAEIVKHHHNCRYDLQCQAFDKYTRCMNDEHYTNKVQHQTCQCIDGYYFNDYNCQSNDTTIDYPWFHYDWYSKHWVVFITILIAVSTGLCVLMIVLSISMYLRMKARRNNQVLHSYKYPPSFGAKTLVKRYFGRDVNEDKRKLTMEDSLSKY